ncbi:hybrid sensor histidine kinase/response regulator [Candidatus Dependentiae bacterium]|nr:hybrid sensor histidine kinase/response regulator [Candidatus Dependentiae bacterium]
MVDRILISHEFKIVIVDDVYTNLQLIVNVLSSNNKNFKFITFTEGREAYEYICQNNDDIDLVLLDIILPDLSGLEICKLLKNSSDTEHIPIILITAKSDSEDRVEGFKSGADDYIPKPFNSTELNARVNMILKNTFMKKYLENQNKKLKRLNDIKDIFLSTASHDIRNNLTGIIGHCYLILMQKYGKLDSKYQQSLKIILKRSKNISNLVDNIIDAAKLESGKLVLNIMATDFNDFLTQYYHDIITLYTYEELDFSLEIEDNLNTVFIDIQKVDEILTNLINNAVKFSQKGGKIIIGAKSHNENFIKCYVKDNGIGIKNEDLPYIFDRFANIDSKIKIQKKIKSSGLGLSICKGIVESHGGKIWVASEQDKGTTFYFTLPKNENVIPATSKTQNISDD